ncbi:hypothetical protein COM86_12715 [Priestia megaterium]|uniref:hypothetical protein n=1 Tax=Priestia megaterium TaxID=1404 RepID=UPI000BECEEC5|nr:hypothetical protein [Priestia megaterium]MED3972251.1 hypothetical protein [Priestia megaterium]PEB63313.1 hypothetical protein COM86_12715 [Priestia megaterium]
MNIYDLIEELLAPLEVTTGVIKVIDPPETYITYFQYDEGSAGFVDDKEARTIYFIQVDVWSKIDTFSLGKQVQNILTENGFIRRSVFHDYEEDTELFRQGMRFYYTQNNNN